MYLDINLTLSERFYVILYHAPDHKGKVGDYLKENACLQENLFLNLNFLLCRNQPVSTLATRATPVRVHACRSGNTGLGPHLPLGQYQSVSTLFTCNEENKD